jgi:hypothetical protein
MNNKKKLFFSFLIAAGWTLFFLAHRKIGGLLSGGIYSDPHTWEEMKAFIPGSILLFFTIMAGAFIYFFIINREVDVICPKCEKNYRSVKIEKCSICGERMEPLEGFYRRHPELPG